ncbi:MAG: acetate/propionate family kinase, partial [Culicoidibacterales bacterium]
SVVVTDQVERDIEELASLAPLHNPANLEGIRTFKALLPNAVSTAVFDTSFHQTMKPESFMYPLPYEYYEKHKVRRYGAHGTSHQFVSQRTAELIGKDYSDSKIIVAHLGNGASITAVKNGESVETSMGFTPLAGLMMGTRTGDIDPAITAYLIEKTGLDANGVTNVYNKQSGLAGVSGLTSDMRDIIAGVESGNERAKLAFDMYTKRVAEYIAMYYMNMDGADAIAFTAGIGENATPVRQGVIERLSALGIKIDEEENKKRGEHKISAEESSVAIYVVPTNEELVIARDTQELMK